MATTLHRDSWDQYVAIVEKEAADLCAEIERLTAELAEWKAAADTEARLRREYHDKAERLTAENERLRAALRCEEESGTCVMVHDPEREPCDAENCRYVRALNQQLTPRKEG